MPDIFTNTVKKPATEIPPISPQPSVKLSSSLPNPDQTSNPGIFSSYCLNPVGISFANQEDDETIVLFLRRHFITNLSWIIYTLFFLLLPLLVVPLINISGISLFIIPPNLMLVLGIFYYLLVWNYAFNQFITWFYHVGIVTQKRLVDLDVDNILHYHLAETNIGDVVDVSYSQKGFFQSFFNFGDIPIQTEAIKANFMFDKAPHPATVADIITDLRPHLKGKKPHA